MHAQSIAFKALQWYGCRLPHPGHYRVVDRLRRAMRADVDAELTVARGGLRWRLNPSDFVQQDVFWYGTKDRWDLAHLRRLLPTDACIADVGASFGYYALHLAHALGPRARALAFEPLPAMLARLEDNIALNRLGDQVEAVGVALADAKGTATIRVGAGNSGSAQVLAGGGPPAISLDTLDARWTSHMGSAARCALIKLDVEGFESKVLAGACELLARDRPIVLMEVDAPRLAECGASPRDLQVCLDRLGYRYVYARRNELVATSLEHAPAMVNVLCLPAGVPTPSAPG